MKIQIGYLDKLLILDDEKNIFSAIGESFEIFNVNSTTFYSEIDNILTNWLDEHNSYNLYLKFYNNEILLSFIEMYLPFRFKLMYAAGGLVHHPEKGYLFIFKRGYWDLPKGKIDDNENAEQAAIRECKEETGVNDLKLEKNLGITYHIFNQKKEWILKITQWYLMATSDNNTLTPQTEEGIEKVEWIEKEKWNERVMNKTYFSIKEVLQRAENV